MAQGLFERPERRQVFGGAAGDEARAVGEAADLDRQRPGELAGRAAERFDREPGERGRGGKRDQVVVACGRRPVDIDPGLGREAAGATGRAQHRAKIDLVRRRRALQAAVPPLRGGDEALTLRPAS